MSNDSQPSLLGAHVQYVKGAVEGMIGSATNSSAWSQSGETDVSAGIEGMKAASANRDPAKDGYGKAEEIAGKWAGCEGMEQEGAASVAGAGSSVNEGRGGAVNADTDRLV